MANYAKKAVTRLKCSIMLALGLGLVLSLALVWMNPEANPLYPAENKEVAELRNELREMSRATINQLRNKTLALKRLQTGDNNNAVSSFYSANELSGTVRILCMVLTSPWTIKSRAVYIQKTWARRCNNTIFVSSSPSDDLPSVKVVSAEGQFHLTQKLMLGIKEVYGTEFSSGPYDWLLIAEDDTYAILENVRYLLKDTDPKEPIYFGQKGSRNALILGAGVVLSRELLRRMDSADLKTCFSQDGRFAGYVLGMCLSNIGGIFGDSADINGNSRFHASQKDPLNENEMLKGMSNYTITMHSVSGITMMEIELLVYHILLPGVPLRFSDLNKPKTLI